MSDSEAAHGSPAASHYDRITEVWMKWIMGENLHFGLFDGPQASLTEATDNLTARLVEVAQLEPGMTVLDVGCGVGTAAMRIAEQHGCSVIGISTSAVGLDLAKARAAERGLSDKLQFVLSDAMDNQLAAASFDRVFSLESTHLMPDKQALFAECARVLRPGGRLALCDVTLVDRLNSEQERIAGYRMMGHSKETAGRMMDAVNETMYRAFGGATMSHYRVYEEAARAAGFENIEVQDVSSQTRRTLEYWCRNASANWDAIETMVGKRYLDDFFLAALHMSFSWGKNGGYVLMAASSSS